MLDLIEKLLPGKTAKVLFLLVLLTVGGMIAGIKGVAFIKAQAQETARTEVKVIINDELRAAAQSAATDAARIAAREAAKETLEQIRAELSKQTESLKRLEEGQKKDR